MLMEHIACLSSTIQFGYKHFNFKTSVKISNPAVSATTAIEDDRNYNKSI